MYYLSIKRDCFSVKENLILVLWILVYLGNVIASEDTITLVHVVSITEIKITFLCFAIQNISFYSCLGMEIEHQTTTPACIPTTLIYRTSFILTEEDN